MKLELVFFVEAYFNYKDVYEAFNDNLWGGTKLRAVFGKKCVYDVIGESWQLSAHPDGQSVIASGKGIILIIHLLTIFTIVRR